MTRTRTSHVVGATSVAALALLGLGAGPALADGGSGPSILHTSLVGSMPAPASPQVAGLNPGMAPWVNGPSRVRVREGGWVTVRIRGLVIPPPVGTGVNPVASVVATLVCGGGIGPSTQPFALSTTGDGSTTQVVTGAGHCTDPVVLIQPAGNRAVYIASTTPGASDD